MDNLTTIFDLYETQHKAKIDDEDMIATFMMLADTQFLKDVKKFIEENYMED